MSKLIQKGNASKLRNRGPLIVPEETLNPDKPLVEENELIDESVIEQGNDFEVLNGAPLPDSQEQRNGTATQNITNSAPAALKTTVRISKMTRNRLNALVHMGQAETVEAMMDKLIRDYVNRLPQGDLRIFNSFVSVYDKKLKS